MISLRSFRRITSSTNFIPEIDGLRFIAIITVVFLHTNTNFKRVYTDGIPAEYLSSCANYIFSLSGVGVDIFFSISGFILGLPFARYYLLGERKVNIKNYFIRRLTRLEPPYIIAMLGLYVVVTLFNHVGFTEYFDNLIASLFYSHYIIYGEWSPINPVTWSLETEVQFYVLAPLISMILFSKNAWVRRVLLAAVLVALDFAMPALRPALKEVHLNKSILIYLHSFLVGYAFVDIYLFELNKIKKSYLYDVLGVISLVLIYTNHPDTTSWWLAFDLGVLSLFLAVFRGIIFNKLFTLELLTVIGGMCYTIYLLHYPVLFIVMKGLSSLHISSFIPNIIVNFAVAILSLLAVSAVFFKLIEQPCMDKNWPAKLKEYFKKRLNLANVKS